MNLYAVALMLHIVGAAGLFAALGVEGAAVFSLSRATTSREVRAALSAFGLNRFVGPPSILATLAPGLFMIRIWGWTPWIATSLALVSVVVTVGVAVTGRTTARLQREVGTAEGPRWPIREPILTASFLARTAILATILVLMVAKPDLPASLTVAGAAASLGLLLFLRARLTRAVQDDPSG